MEVRDLIERLQKCNPEGIICVEANDIPNASEVVQYTFENGDCYIYICDNTEYLDEVIEKSKKEVIE